MICKNCSAEYDDGLEACPYCTSEENETVTQQVSEAEGAPEEKDGAPEEVTEEEENIPQEPTEDSPEAETDGEESTDGEEDFSEETTEEAEESEEAAEENEEASQENTEASSEENSGEAAAEEAAEAETASEEASEVNGEQREERKPAPARRPAPSTKKPPVRRARNVVTKAEKKAIATIKILTCIVGVLVIVFSVLNITTDIFENGDSSEKMVASVGFAPQQEKELEVLLADCFSAAKQEYSCDTTDAESFLERIKPGDKGNVYSKINKATEKLQTEPDPAQRFADEEGNYSYYKLHERKVDKVLSLFGLDSHRGENTENYYYCDGYYYFANEKVGNTPSVKAKITKSRRVLDGSYYAECYFYVENGEEVKKTDICNFVIEMTAAANGETVYKIRKINAKPIFGSDGKVLESQKTCEKKK